MASGATMLCEAASRNRNEWELNVQHITLPAHPHFGNVDFAVRAADNRNGKGLFAHFADPSMRSLRLLVWIAMLASAWRPAVAPAADEKMNSTDRRAVQTQLHSRLTLDRVDGMRRLGDFPPLEGARLVLQIGLTDREPDVREAASAALLAWKDDPEVGGLVLKGLEKEVKKSGGVPIVPLLKVLAASELPETQQRLGKFLDGFVPKSKEGVPAVIGLADELGTQGDAPGIRSLQGLLQHKAVLGKFACRRAVVQAILGIRRPESVSAAIALLPTLDGEVRGDVVRYLEATSGQHHGLDVKLWEAWWKEHSEDFKFSRKVAESANTETVPPGVGSYYGLPLYARRIVFVVDISGSMRGPRLTAAKRELSAAIAGLSTENDLGLVAFHTQLFVWRRELVRATPTLRQEANTFVYQLQAGGRTATYDALDAAFRYDTEAIFLLSDGEPNAGKIPFAVDILTAVARANRHRRISIYTIGIAPGMAGSPMDEFMRTLGEQNYGRYHRVEE